MANVKPATVLLAAAAIAFVASWFAPVTVQDRGYAGWEAFRTILQVLWSPAQFGGRSHRLVTAIWISTALTNVVFIAAFIAVVTSWRTWIRGLKWAVLAAAALDLYWYFGMDHLKIGYYLWVASFFVLFAAMARRSVS
jgi:hypothetical protein